MRHDRNDPRPPAVIASATRIVGEARLAARSLLEFGQNLFNPTVRLGITGLSRAGKTVFITALVHGLLRGGRFPVFEPHAGGRIAGARLEPQPDDAVPRFDYERHLQALVHERRWPESTRQIGELRLVIDYQSRNGAHRTLTLDIVDYPGEWLLDLPLLEMSYEQWSAQSIRRSREEPRRALARDWHAIAESIDPQQTAQERDAIALARAFTAYLRACRDERVAMSVLPPGRFLMPGDLDGSPALTFAPLDLAGEDSPSGSLRSMMRRRYEAYKDVVVRPFFTDHFQRIDRQIVLVDALAAFNAGVHALRDLESALSDILDCFQVGRRTMLSTLFRPRADRILFAATKADHLHQSNHDRLEAIVGRMVTRVAEHAKFSGAQIDIVALAAVRATREATVSHEGETLPCIVGEIEGEAGKDVAVFPGDLPAEPGELFEEAGHDRDAPALRFMRFRPPRLEPTEKGVPALPHIRLDRALQFLLGDRLA